MNPRDAYDYMSETGKSVVAEKIPHWAANEPGKEEWIKHRYQVQQQDTVVELYDDASCASVVVKVWDTGEWLNWWMNFCYNTNSAHHNVELLPYENPV